MILPFLFFLAACDPFSNGKDDTGHPCGAGTHWDGDACVVDEDTDTDADTDADTDTDADSDADGDSDADADGDADTDADVDYDVCDDGIAPYSEIQDAVDAAVDGDVIRICAGIWGGVEIARQELSLVGVDGAAVTVIDGGSGTAVSLDDATVALSGLTLTGTAPSTTEPAALVADGSNLTVEDSVVSDSVATDYAPAVLLTDSYAAWDGVVFQDNEVQVILWAKDGGSLSLQHCTFHRNSYAPTLGWGGGLVYVYEVDLEFHNNLLHHNLANHSELLCIDASTSTAWIYNNTIADNENIASNPDVLRLRYSGITFENNIVANNDGIGIWAQSGATVGYSDIYGNSGQQYYDPGGGSLGATNIVIDPRFTDASGGDYSLDTGFSPCIDAGNPLSGYNDPDGSRNDMGAFGGPYGIWTPAR
ncbi:MAG: hypothetical protein ABIO70_25895 [Pseudomonadota bacterium]